MPDSTHRRERRPRSRSPRRHDRERTHRRRSRSPQDEPVRLPFGTQPLSKHDLKEFKPTFGLYLDIQKRIDIDELSNDELKGRWKSFVNKWNRKELSEGWYDPATKQRADKAASEQKLRPQPARRTELEKTVLAEPQAPEESEEEDDNNDDDDFGPALPGARGSAGRMGPVVPSLQDIQHRNELAREEDEAGRENLRYERKLDRRTQKERLDELAPRADPGSRERQMEKKRETAAANREFREAKSPGAEDVGERDVMGDDGIEGYKARLQAVERKKNERELRKEEMLRARAAEREERLAEHRAKEEKTMEMLKALARQNFG